MPRRSFKKVMLHLGAYNGHLFSVSRHMDFSGAWAGNTVYGLNPLSISVGRRHNNCQYKFVRDTRIPTIEVVSTTAAATTFRLVSRWLW